MLVLLIQWLLISIIGLSFGKLTEAGLNKIWGSYSEEKLPAVFVFLLGLSAITFLGNVWSLVFPIGLTFQASLLLVSLLYLLSSRASYFKALNINLFLLLPLLCVALLLALHPTSNVDEAGYYLPQVKWIESYPVIKGTALFIARLGFNSALHMLSAIFGASSFIPGGIYELNGLLFIWFNYYFFSAVLRLSRSKSKDMQSDLLLSAALIFPFSFLIDAMDSDYMVTMGSIIIIAQILRELSGEKRLSASMLLSYLFIIILLIQIKPFAGLLLIGPIVLLARNNYSTWQKMIGFSLCLLLISPWLIRNVFISGYLVFPAYYLDLFNCAWKIPLEMAQASLAIIEEHAKVQSIRLDYKLSGIEKLKFSDWLPTWVAFQKEQIIGWATLLLLPISCFLLLTNTARVIMNGNRKRTELCLLYFALGVIIFWFYSFPAIRFGWSWILSFIVVNLVLYIQLFAPKLQKQFVFIMVLLAGLSWSRLVYHSLRNVSKLTTNLITPPETITEIKFTTYTLADSHINVSADAYCHGAHPPCQPHNNPYKIVAIGEKITDGFKVEE